MHVRSTTAVPLPDSARPRPANSAMRDLSTNFAIFQFRAPLLTNSFRGAGERARSRPCVCSAGSSPWHFVRRQRAEARTTNKSVPCGREAPMPNGPRRRGLSPSDALRAQCVSAALHTVMMPRGRRDRQSRFLATPGPKAVWIRRGIRVRSCGKRLPSGWAKPARAQLPILRHRPQFRLG